MNAVPHSHSVPGKISSTVAFLFRRRTATKNASPLFQVEFARLEHCLVNPELTASLFLILPYNRFDPDEPPRSYLQSREESMHNENESVAASPGTMLGRHLGRLNIPATRRFVFFFDVLLILGGGRGRRLAPPHGVGKQCDVA